MPAQKFSVQRLTYCIYNEASLTVLVPNGSFFFFHIKRPYFSRAYFEYLTDLVYYTVPAVEERRRRDDVRSSMYQVRDSEGPATRG